jgi:hypothetical protein
VQQNYSCGCGIEFHACEFWQAVGQEAFGGWERVDAEEMLRLKAAVTRYRNWPAHLASPSHGEFASRAALYADAMRRVYAAVSAVSGARTVVDNSHDISPALLLTQSPDIHVRVVHLVRDSRGVVNSLARYVARPEATGGATYMTRYGAVRASAEWVAANLPYHLIPRRRLPRLRVRYESLVASPSTEIARIAEFAGDPLAPSTPSIYEGDSIEIAPKGRAVAERTGRERGSSDRPAAANDSS